MKRVTEKMRTARSRRTAALLIAAAAFACLTAAVGTTYAWMNSADSRNNKISVIQYVFSHQIGENFTVPPNLRGGDTVAKENWVENDGDIACFVRVKAFPVMTMPDGETHLQVQFGTQLQYVYNDLPGYNASAWLDGGDGYFYYLGKVAPGGKTPALFDEVELDTDVVEYSDGILTVTLIAETVECGKYLYRQAWWNNGTGVPAVDTVLSALATD